MSQREPGDDISAAVVVKPASPPRVARLGVVVLGLIGGWLMWSTLFALAFTSTYGEYRRDAVVPLLLFAGVAFLFGVMNPRLWVRAAVALALPTVLCSSWFCYALVSVGQGFEPEYLLDMGAVALCAFGGAGLGAFCGARRHAAVATDRTSR